MPCIIFSIQSKSSVVESESRNFNVHVYPSTFNKLGKRSLYLALAVFSQFLLGIYEYVQT